MPERHEMEDFRTLNRTLPEIGRILEEYLGVPLFFITLHPTQWALQYYSGTVPQSSGERDVLDAVIKRFSRCENKKDLDDLICWMADRSTEFSREDLFQAADRLLAANELSLGWINSGDGSATRAHWLLDQDRPAPLRWFQFALDFAFVYQFDAARVPPEERGKVVFDDNSSIMRVPEYISAPLLVDATSFRSYFAEYLYSQRGEIPKPHLGESQIPEEKKPSKLDHFFVPLAGFGQWRAAACWIVNRSKGLQIKRERKIDRGRGLHDTLQSLFSQILVDAFARNLDSALVQWHEQTEGSTAIYNAFASLWWSHEIAFFRSGQCVARLLRDPRSGSLELSAHLHSSLEPLESERFLSTCYDSAFSLLQLDLKKLPQLDEEVRDVLFGFDQVVFSIPLFDQSFEMNVKSLYAERIAERLLTAPQLYNLRRSATRLQIVEVVGHHMKSTVTITGWRRALQLLQEFQERQENKSPDVDEAIHSLSLFEFVEGSGGLLRLMSLCFQGYFDKLSDWTSPRSLARWYEEDPGRLLALYVEYIKRFVTVHCRGLNWRRGFHLTVEREDGTEELDIDTGQLPGGSIREWIDELGEIPPLSARYGPDAHVTLLSTLTEALCNAIKTLQKLHKDHGRVGSLLVRVIPDFPRQVRVEIGNDIAERPKAMAQGLSQTREVLRFTDLATISEIKEDDLHRYWIQTDLHPVRLVERILQPNRKEE
jgi:hypothetical protein